MPFVSPPSAMTAAQFRKLLDSKNLSLTDAATVTYRNVSTISRYLNGEVPIDHGVVALVQLAEARAAKKGPGGRLPEPAPKQRKAKR